MNKGAVFSRAVSEARAIMVSSRNFCISRAVRSSSVRCRTRFSSHLRMRAMRFHAPLARLVTSSASRYTSISKGEVCPSIALISMGFSLRTKRFVRPKDAFIVAQSVRCSGRNDRTGEKEHSNARDGAFARSPFAPRKERTPRAKGNSWGSVHKGHCIAAKRVAAAPWIVASTQGGVS